MNTSNKGLLIIIIGYNTMENSDLVARHKKRVSAKLFFTYTLNPLVAL